MYDVGFLSSGMVAQIQAIKTFKMARGLRRMFPRTNTRHPRCSTVNALHIAPSLAHLCSAGDPTYSCVTPSLFVNVCLQLGHRATEAMTGIRLGGCGPFLQIRLLFAVTRSCQVTQSFGALVTIELRRRAKDLASIAGSSYLP